MGGFGSNLSQDKAPDSFSPFRRDRASNPARHAVVVVEDNVGDVFLVKEAVRTAKLDLDLYFIADGDEALRFFGQIDESTVRCPDLLLLDLNIPKSNGFEVAVLPCRLSS